MKEKYLYNQNTHTLHIKGYCTHSKGERTGYMIFDSEDEALAYDGRAVGMCKICLKQREKMMDAEKY